LSKLKPQKQRIDCLLLERGLFETREKAQRAIMAGAVRVGDKVADKPGARVAADVVITVKDKSRYVGRGGLKLEAALKHFGIDPTGKICLDIGASTGGFTDCLLQHGAEKVHSVDVGHSQLDWKIRSDRRVAVREKFNARHMTRDDIPDPISVCVIDVSFISLTLILPPAFAVLEPDGVILALIKPQFELGKEIVDIGRGVVRDVEAQQSAVKKIETFVRETLAKSWCGVIESPILGGDGNREFLACLRN
jgi:23S rRNA (cytidine1920-2'-O)/16S rRNA (cytidine1409-2'-O)-methyltransferase